MVRTMAGTLPWAVVVALAGGLIWWLLTREMGAGRWLLAALLLGHGLVHLLFAVPASAAADDGSGWPFEMTRSWLISGAGLDAGLVRAVGLALVAIVVGGFSLAALSTVGVVVPVGLWRPLVVLSAGASAGVLILFFQPQLVLGLGVDAVLLWVVIAWAWQP